MSKQRLIDTRFWDDSYVLTLDPSEKLVFLYLLTNPLTAICGVYEVALRRIAFDTGFDADTVTRILGRLERDGRCVYRDGWVALRNWLKYQRINHPRIAAGIWRALNKAPPDLRQYVENTVPEFVQHPRANMKRWTDYRVALQDPRWHARRLEILERDEHKCKECGRNDRSLHVHHLRYLPNHQPWEYEDADLVTLCESCHARAHHG